MYGFSARLVAMAFEVKTEKAGVPASELSAQAPGISQSVGAAIIGTSLQELYHRACSDVIGPLTDTYR
jgi:hypothetical protein